MPDVPPSPLEPRDRDVRRTVRTAAIWIGLAGLAYLTVRLSDALLVIFGGLVFAAAFNGGAELIGRAVRLPYWARLALTLLIFLGAISGFLAFAGLQIAEQAGQLSETVQRLVTRVGQLLEQYNIGGGDPVQGLVEQARGSLGEIGNVVGSVAGGLSTFFLMIVIGAYVAADTRLYDRGVEWLTPEAARPRVESTLREMAATLKRWVAGRLATMLIEGVLTFALLTLVGVPLAGVLALIAGVLAFIPTVGAIVSGFLIIAVGFTAGTDVGLYAIGVCVAVSLIEGDLLTPMIEKRAVDIAPALVLAALLVFGTLFGILGLALADPIVAMVKVALQGGERERPA